MNLKKAVQLTARVEANNGTLAFCVATDDNFFVLTRGWSYGCKNLFADEFKVALPVGRKINILTDGVECKMEVK